MPWGNELLGSSKYYIHAFGGALTILAEIVGLTPSEVNEKLKAIDAFGPDATGEKDQIIWEKISVAFPGWSAQFIEPYNNDVVLDGLSKGRSILVLVDGEPVYQLGGHLHALRYMGNGICHDPMTGAERPTNDFPNVKSFVVLTFVQPEVAKAEEETVAPASPEVTPPTNPDTTPVVTFANLPMNEKEAILAQVQKAQEEIKKLLAI